MPSLGRRLLAFSMVVELKGATVLGEGAGGAVPRKQGDLGLGPGTALSLLGSLRLRELRGCGYSHSPWGQSRGHLLQILPFILFIIIYIFNFWWMLFILTQEYFSMDL